MSNQNVFACLDAKVANGDIGQDTADDLKDRLNRAQKETGNSTQAQRKVLDDLEQEDAANKLKSATQSIKNSEIQQRVRSLVGMKRKSAKAKVLGFGNEDTVTPEQIANSFLDRDTLGDITGPNVSSESTRLRRLYHAQIGELLNEASPGVFGDLAVDVRNVVRSMMGERLEVDDPVAERAGKAFDELQEMMQGEMTRQGGRLPFTRNQGPSMQFDRNKLINLEDQNGFEEAKRQFIDDMKPLVDREKMAKSSGADFTDQDVEDVLDGTFNKILRPFDDVDSGGVHKITDINTQSALPRAIRFKDSDSFIAAVQKYGPARGSSNLEQSLYDMLVREINDNADDTAMLQVLGPEPVRGLETIEQELKRQDPQGSPNRFGAMRDMFNHFSGRSNVPDNQSMNENFVGFRSAVNAAKLGGAMITAIADLGFNGTTTAFTTGSAKRGTLGLLKRLVELQDPRQQRAATRLGLGNEHNTSRVSDMNRATHDENQTGRRIPGFMQRVQKAVIKGSLLERWTAHNRWAFQMELMQMLTETGDAGVSFSQLPNVTRRTFERYGLDADDWEVMKRADVRRTDEETGETFIHPNMIASVNRETANKMMRMLISEEQLAVPSPGLREQSGLTFGTQAGTIGGEITRTATMLKSFPVTVYHKHLGRTLDLLGNEGGGTALKYFSALTVSTVGLGMMSQQLDNLVAGRDPQPWNDADFIQSAIGRAGTFGLASDILSGQVADFGLASTLLGPAFDVTQEGLELGSNIAGIPSVMTQMGINATEGKSLFDDIDSSAGRDAAQFFEEINPLGSLWQTELLLDRVLHDNIQRLLDPEAEDSFKASKRFVEDEMNSEFFFGPGDLNLLEGEAEIRGPELKRALGEE